MKMTSDTLAEYRENYEQIKILTVRKKRRYKNKKRSNND